MAKKERLGTDPLKGGPLSWISDTRKEKKPEEKQNIKDNTDVKTAKRLSTKTSMRQNVKTFKRQDTKKPVIRKRHTIYLSASLSKKLRVYAAANDIQMSEVVEKLINDNL